MTIPSIFYTFEYLKLNYYSTKFFLFNIVTFKIIRKIRINKETLIFKKLTMGLYKAKLMI